MTTLYRSFAKLFQISVKDGWIPFPPPLLPTEKDFHKSHSLNSAFPHLILCPSVFTDHCHTSLYICSARLNKNPLISFIPRFPQLFLSCTCSRLNLSLPSMSHWVAHTVPSARHEHTLGEASVMQFWDCNAFATGFCLFFFFTLLVSQKNLRAVNSPQSSSSAMPTLVPLVVLPQVSCMSSGISLHLLFSSAEISKSFLSLLPCLFDLE